MKEEKGGHRWARLGKARLDKAGLHSDFWNFSKNLSSDADDYFVGSKVSDNERYPY
jgi:hypothetical protein